MPNAFQVAPLSSRIVPLSPTASTRAVLSRGALTARRVVVTPLGIVDHDVPSNLRIVPPAPTAYMAEELAPHTAYRSLVVPVAGSGQKP